MILHSRPCRRIRAGDGQTGDTVRTVQVNPSEDFLKASVRKNGDPAPARAGRIMYSGIVRLARRNKKARQRVTAAGYLRGPKLFHCRGLQDFIQLVQESLLPERVDFKEQRLGSARPIP